MIIFPAIDLLDGECVRLLQGDFERKTTYSTNPIEVAELFQSQGAQWLHVVDLDGARSGKQSNFGVIRDLAQLGLNLQVGGGIRSMDSAYSLIDSGVKRIVAGSSLVQNPQFRNEFFKLKEYVVAGLDVQGDQLAIHGWKQTGDVDLMTFLQVIESEGCARYVLTDIATDGMQSGPNLDLLNKCLANSSMKIVHSGGIGTYAHLQALKDLNNERLEGIIIGRAIYEKSVELPSVLQQFKS